MANSPVHVQKVGNVINYHVRSLTTPLQISLARSRVSLDTVGGYLVICQKATHFLSNET